MNLPLATEAVRAPLSFLSPAPGLAAVSPLDHDLEAAGAKFAVRAGWRVATRFADAEKEARTLQQAVGWADMSHLPKFEVHDRRPRREGWWCPLTPRRALVLGAAVPDALDVTTQYGALLLAGPAARETIARFCAIDLRPQVAPPASFRPGSVARTPGAVLVQAADRYLLLFGAAVASYVWTVVSDAGAHLGGRPVGVDAVSEEALGDA